MTWCMTIPSTGEVSDDSVLVSINDIRIANSKMLELVYVQKVNELLQEHLDNDSIIISNLENEVVSVKKKYSDNVKEIKRQRNIFGGVSIISLLLLVLSLL